MSTFSIGQSVGRYRILRKLGSGAMGDVYLAEDPRIERQLAIKAVRFEGAGGSLQRMVLEAKAAGRLIHPNIVTLFDVGEEGENFFLAFEFVDGTDLAVRLAAAPPLTLGEVFSITRQAAAALHCAHQQGVVHRDIKPSNLLLDGAGNLKVADFGIAKLAGQTAELTMTGSVVGSPHYMSPEQVRGEELDGRSDLFSLGTVLYEMVGGRRPFEGDTITTLIYQILHHQPVPPPGLAGPSQPLLQSLLERLLAKDREERFSSAAQLEAALAEAQRTLPQSVLAGSAAPSRREQPGDHLTTLTAASSAPAAVAPASAVRPGERSPQPSPVIPPPTGGTVSTQETGRKWWAVPALSAGVTGLALVVTLLAVAGFFVKVVQDRAGEMASLGTSTTSPPPSAADSAQQQAASPQRSEEEAEEAATPPDGEAPGDLDPAGGQNDTSPAGGGVDAARDPVRDPVEGSVGEPVVNPAAGTLRSPPHESEPPASSRRTGGEPPPAKVSPLRPLRPRPARRAPTPGQQGSGQAAPGKAVNRLRSKLLAARAAQGAARPHAFDRKVHTGMTLLIESTPPGAFLVIDGFVIGRANEVASRGGHTLAEPGEHWVILRSPGMREYRLLVNADAAMTAKTRVKIAMKRALVSELEIGDLPRYLVREAVGFRVKPKSARVVIDGAIRGTAGELSGRGGRWLSLSRGLHRISLIAPGHHQVDIVVEVGGGATEKRQIVHLSLPAERP